MFKPIKPLTLSSQKEKIIYKPPIIYTFLKMQNENKRVLKKGYSGEL